MMVKYTKNTKINESTLYLAVEKTITENGIGTTELLRRKNGAGLILPNSLSHPQNKPRAAIYLGNNYCCQMASWLARQTSVLGR